uniref:Rho-related GTP-binding protein RhoG n=1 Tax=Panagrellus redivivus TaxID=6233 RepID=A0A7E4V8E5_PANRE
MSIKCVVVGDENVGKTAMLFSYTKNMFPGAYVPTIVETFTTTVHISEKAYNLHIFDTAGQETCDRLRPLSYQKANLIIICFSVVNPASFENVKDKWFPEVRHYCPNTPFILVGTQSDLRSDPEVNETLANEKQTQVSFAAGFQLAKEYNAIRYVECSAYNQRGLKEIFDHGVIAVINQQKKKRKCVLL